MENNKEQEGTENGVSSPKSSTGALGGQSIYVKKWMRTKHAIMFRLSNKIVQVNF